jgi:hypothetical protein
MENIHEPSAKERMPHKISQKRKETQAEKKRLNKIALAFELAFRRMGITE